MATSTISNTILDASSTPIANVRVVCKLMPSAGFRTADATEVSRSVETTSNGSGVWSLLLEENAGISPGNSYYQITEHIPGDPVTWNVSVGASDQTVLAALTRPLSATAGSAYLTQVSADARYQALSALGAGTPATIVPGGAGTAGVATSASRSDHNHPMTAAAVQALVIPAGTIWSMSVASTPTGWLLCDGTEALGATYPALATEFGTGAGSRHGSATTSYLKLPDLRRAFPMGKAASGTGSTLGGTGGSKDAVVVTHNHTQDSHNHTQDSHNHTQNAHGHGASQAAHRHSFENDDGFRFLVTSGGATDLANPGAGGTQTNYSFGAMDTEQPTVTVNNDTATNQGFTATNQGQTATNQAAGVSGTDANLPPWVAVNYYVKAH